MDSTTGDTTMLANGHAHHPHGQCEPTRSLEGRRVDAVICRGLGRRALERLEAAGVRVLTTDAWTVGEAMEAFRAGALPPLEADRACAGGHHVHGSHRT